jgi:hypothetical protein
MITVPAEASLPDKAFILRYLPNAGSQPRGPQGRVGYTALFGCRSFRRLTAVSCGVSLIGALDRPDPACPLTRPRTDAIHQGRL